MLASTKCLRAFARPSQSLASRPLGPVLWQTRRVFASTPRHRKTESRIQIEHKQPNDESIKPESVEKEKPAEPPKKQNDPLLAEQTVSNKQQRQADWAIMKDMAHYLWPKNDFGTRFRVGLSLGLLIGAKVRHATFMYIWQFYVDRLHRSSMCKSLSTSSPLSIA